MNKQGIPCSDSITAMYAVGIYAHKYAQVYLSNYIHKYVAYIATYIFMVLHREQIF